MPREENADLEDGVSVRNATHVRVGNRIERIVDTWGVYPEGGVAPPSKGGFGVITEGGRRVTMHEANSYLREKSAK